jgi:regulator of replication initiation timing
VEKQDIFAQINDVEERMAMAYSELTALKQKLITLLEENHRLTIENAQLRKIMHNQEDEHMEGKPSAGLAASMIGHGHDNLLKLYNEGFHICNVYYGHLRTEGDCLFCMSFLHK